jgi:hypothetical protein
MFFYKWWLKISAKPLFIGSIPIAASNLHPTSDKPLTFSQQEA